jgi:predicted Ser/Thr protein kinase
VSGKWKVGLRIGKGTFSEVYVASNRVTKEVVAVKVDKPPPKHGAQTESQLDPEYKVLKALQAYPFFPRLLDFW